MKLALTLVLAFLAINAVYADDCDFTCHNLPAPLCASNGKVYESPCEMRKDACITGTNIEIKHYGPCVTPDLPKPEACRQVCPMIFSPVCSTQDVQYQNLCELKNAACMNVDIQLKNEGPCKTAALPQDCDEICLDEFTPICASNGKTYPNTCVMRREACRTSQALELIAFGPCPVADSDANRDCEAIVCDENYEPVCASDGVTYASKCKFDAASCLAGYSLSVVHLGECMTVPNSAWNTPVVGVITVGHIVSFVIAFVVSLLVVSLVLFLLFRKKHAHVPRPSSVGYARVNSADSEMEMHKSFTVSL